MAEELRGREARPGVEPHVLGDVAHGIDDALAGVEPGDALLRVIAEADCLPDVEAARVGLELAQEHAQQGGLARAVGTHDADFVVAGECVAPVFQDHLVAECLADVVRFEDLGADV